MKKLKQLRLPSVASAVFILLVTFTLRVVTHISIPAVDTRCEETQALAAICIFLLMVFYMSHFARAVVIGIALVVLAWLVYVGLCIWCWYKKKYLDPKEGTRVQAYPAYNLKPLPRRLTPTPEEERRRRRNRSTTAEQDTIRVDLNK